MPEFGSWELVRAIYGNPLVRAVLGLMLANVIIGLAVSLHTKNFALGATADWLRTRAVPYILGAGAIQLVLLTVPEEYLGGMTDAFGSIIWMFCIAALLGQLLGQLKQLGMPVPSVLTTRELVEKKKRRDEAPPRSPGDPRGHWGDPRGSPPPDPPRPPIPPDSV